MNFFGAVIDADYFLVGGFGNDTYVFNIGDGEDHVTDSAGSNTIQFGAGITLADIKLNALVAAGTRDLEIAYDDQGDRIQVYGGMNGGVDQYRFADGASYTRDQLIAFAARATTASAGNDVLQGMDSAETMNGGGSNDTLDGGTDSDENNMIILTSHLAGCYRSSCRYRVANTEWRIAA